MRRWFLTALLAVGLPVFLSGAEDVEHVVVYHNEAEFAGWPANEGMWNWGNEILVCFNVAKYKKNDAGHAAEGKIGLGWARSLDGGKTWTKEEHPEVQQYNTYNVAEMKEHEGPIDFTAEGFAMKMRQEGFFLTDDKGKTWKGPWKLPRTPDAFLLSRTSYVVRGEDRALMFLGSVPRKNTTATERGRSSVVETKDGGKTWEFLGFIGRDPGEGLAESMLPAFSIMPAGLWLGGERYVAALRCRVQREKWTEIYESLDGCRSWRKTAELERGSNNPISLVKLNDGRVAAIYGWRGAGGMGIRARISEDGGRSWGDDLILRKDAVSWDIGYTRAIVRPDGAVVVTYYYDTKARPQQHIEATIWKPKAAAKKKVEAPAMKRAESLQELQGMGLRLISVFGFTEAAGSGLTKLQGLPAGAWSREIPGVSVAGRGVLRVRAKAMGEEMPASYLSLGAYAGVSRAVWVFFQVNGWKFGSEGVRSVYAGIGQRSDKMSAVCQMRFRVGEKGMDVTAEALRSSEGATSGRPVGVKFETGKPVTFALEYRESERMYAVYRVGTDGKLEVLGEGKTSPVRQGKVVHFGVKGDFSGEGDYFDIGTLGVAVIGRGAMTQPKLVAEKMDEGLEEVKKELKEKPEEEKEEL